LQQDARLETFITPIPKEIKTEGVGFFIWRYAASVELSVLDKETF